MKKIFNLFMALMVGATMVSLSSCSKDDKDSGISDEDLKEPLTYTVTNSGNKVTVVGTNKAVKETVEYVYNNDVLGTVNYRREVDCGNAAFAALVVEAAQEQYVESEEYDVTVSQSGSKVVISGTYIPDAEEQSMTQQEMYQYLKMIWE